MSGEVLIKVEHQFNCLFECHYLVFIIKVLVPLEVPHFASEQLQLIQSEIVNEIVTSIHIVIGREDPVAHSIPEFGMVELNIGGFL